MDILGLLDVPLWMILLPAIGLLLYVYGSWTHTTWSSQGVPGPKPLPLLGNSLEIREKDHFHVFQDWQRKYGRVVGYYGGVKPILAVTDMEMLKEIMVKNFNNFSERNIIRTNRNPLVQYNVFFLWGPKWKRIRTMMTPAFSTSKLKGISRFVNRCSHLLVKSIEAKVLSNQLIDIKEVSGNFTMDVIAGTGFGLETNCQTEEGEPFVHHCKKIFSEVSLRGLFRVAFYFVNAFPFFAPILGRLGGFGSNVQFFSTALEEIVDERLQASSSDTKKSSDLLQMMMEAEADPAHFSDSADKADGAKTGLRMSKEEVMAQGFLILIAGFETTATTLQYLTYNLTIHPHVQQKVFEEIQEELGDDELTYESLHKLKYLEAAIRETLRMFPPLAFVSRKADKAMTIRGVRIPAGAGLTIPLFTILHDPEFFPDPEVFDPDRFLEENMSSIHPVVVELPFGYGPRKCMGVRLAMMELKYAAVLMLRKFRFVKCPETPDHILLGTKGAALAVPHEVIKLKAEFRSA